MREQQKVKVKVAESYPTLCDPMEQSMEFSRPEYWSGQPFLSPGTFPIQGSNPGLLHYKQILYHLSHQGSPRILEWVALPFSRGSSKPRNRTGVSCIAGRGRSLNWKKKKLQIGKMYPTLPSIPAGNFMPLLLNLNAIFSPPRDCVVSLEPKF